MSHEWHAGVMSQSSWHGREKLATMKTSDDMIQLATAELAWPTQLVEEGLITSSGLESPDKAVVATYADGHRAVFSSVGNRYRHTRVGEWHGLVRDVVRAGGEPDGAFALRGGSLVLATFRVGKSNGLVSHFTLADSFNGQIVLFGGNTVIRVECANTLKSAMGADKELKQLARIRHTASAEERIAVLREAIGEAIKSGESVRKLYEQARETHLSREQARAAFDVLFPEAPVGTSGRAKTMADKARCEARQAAQMGINREGETRGNVATLWNAATFLVDRNGDGTMRPCRGGADMVDSMLFGSRGKRVEQIAKVIEVVLKDGSIERMGVEEAREHGIDDASMGKQLLESMLS